MSDSKPNESSSNRPSQEDFLKNFSRRSVSLDGIPVDERRKVLSPEMQAKLARLDEAFLRIMRTPVIPD